MALQTKTKPGSARSNDCVVGLLEARELRGKDYTSHLSGNERAHYMRLPNENRKSEWLTGRLAAKWLFLNRLKMSQETQSQQWKPTLSKLSSEALDAYSPWMYQKVEAFSNGGIPSLAWCGKPRPESISLSHSGSVSCASIAFASPTAIDIETSVSRNDAFYRNNFTEAERNWATRGTYGESIVSNWAFTLLWTLKEAALKLGWLNQASLWNLPRIEIDGLPGLNLIESLRSGNAMDDDFVMFTARVKQHRRAIQAQVAVASARNLILTVMNPLSGVTN
jgi:4'-phosphopantetheinyl transferase superfamily protein